MMRAFILAAFALACGAFAPIQSAAAETFRAEYEALMLGAVSIGRATFSGAIVNNRYSANATLRTSGVAALIDQTNLSATSTGVITPRGVAWGSYTLSHAYGRKSRRVTLRRVGAGLRANIYPPYNELGSPPATPQQQIGAYDPISALFALGRNVGQGRVCAGSLRVFDGKQHYRLALSPRAQGAFRGGGYNGPALLCNLRFTPISGFGPMSAADRARIPVLQVWYPRPAQPRFAPPLRITLPTPVGDVVIDLRSYSFSP